MSNPVMSNMFSDKQYVSDRPMTVNGVINKTMASFMLMLISAGVVWYQYSLGYMDKVSIILGVAFVASIIAALFLIFLRRAANILVPVYAICEGLLLGAISSFLNARMPGIVIQAVVCTFSVFFVMLLLYRTKIIRVTDTFRSVIIGATLAIALVYFLSLILQLFNNMWLSNMVHASTPIGLGFSVLVCGIAAFNLLLDFDYIEKGANMGFDKQMEWFGAFGIMVTLVWLYIEILNLLAKLRDR